MTIVKYGPDGKFIEDVSQEELEAASEIYDQKRAKAFQQMQQMEINVIEKTIKTLIDAGFTLGVNDGEETTLRHSASIDKIFKAMRTTDEDYLLVYTSHRLPGRPLPGAPRGRAASIPGCWG